MINRIFVAFTAIILFSLAACSKEHPIERGPVIAKIGNEYLYLYDMIPEGKFPSFSRKDVNFRKNRLKIYIKNEMYNREGYSRGLHKTEAVQEKLFIVRKYLIGNLNFSQFLSHKILLFLF